jgi:hypothetical protein
VCVAPRRTRCTRRLPPACGRNRETNMKISWEYLRFALGVLLLIHTVARVPGFIVPWRLAMLPELPYRTTPLQGTLDVGPVGIRLVGVLWLSGALGFVAAAALVFRGIATWPTLTLAAAVRPRHHDRSALEHRPQAGAGSWSRGPWLLAVRCQRAPGLCREPGGRTADLALSTSPRRPPVRITRDPDGTRAPSVHRQP